MAPSQKRKPAEDDFVFTLSDHEGEVSEEEKAAPAPPPKKKAKTTKKGKATKGKRKTEESEDEAAPEGVWGQNDEDDGAMNSDFEFLQEGAQEFGEADYEGWGFDGARPGINAQKKGVDLDVIIQRRLSKKKEANGETEPAEAVPEVEEEAAADVDLDLDDDEDGVLADDAFGMGAGDDDEDDESQDEEEEDDAASDNDSVATPVDHPEDVDMSSDDEEDPEERAKRDAFFAPEEPAKPGKKNLNSTFQGMSLSRPILRGLASVGFTKPTPIQAKSIPIALMGKDLVGGAVTGSGKTGAFVVPILERLLYRPKKVPTSRVIILLPTRELAIQCHAVAVKLAAFTDIKFSLAVGGLSLKVQEAELRLRPDVIIATPGRFIDHMRNSASFAVDGVEILVLDEADRMLEDGFADELNEILTTLPKSRQTMLFSATMTSSVDTLIRVGMNTPARIMVDSQKKTVVTLTQEFVRLRPGREDKRMGYLLHLCKTLYTERVIIFFRQKKDAHKARIVFGLLGLSCAELHGSLNQTQRIQSVEDFRDGKVNYLLATDLASRGLDIKGIDSVINYEAPQKLEIYVHRVGRTARAGRSGIAVTLAAEPDRKVVKAAVKAGKAQGAKIMSRVIEGAEADKWQAKVDELEEEIEEIMVEEKEERELAQVEMQVKKGENLIKHEDEIKSRPRRTWFESEKDKKKAKEAGKTELNGDREGMKKKGGGKLSNNDRKKLDSKAERAEGPAWKKGRLERAGKGAVLDLKKPKKNPKLKGPVKGKGPVRGKAVKPRGGGEAGNAQAGKLAPNPFRRWRLRPPHSQPHPHHRLSLLRYLFPQSLRERYRERLLTFRLDTLPGLKHRFQSRIYRYILARQLKRSESRRLVDIVRRQGRRLFLGSQSAVAAPRQARYARGRQATTTNTLGLGRPQKMPTLPGFAGGAGAGYGGTGNSYGYGASDPPTVQPNSGERGYRRKKLAAMANNVYKAGASAVNEIREGYAHIPRAGEDEDGHAKTTIPGSFPGVAITVQGDDQMVLFPSYAKRHVKQDWSQVPEVASATSQGSIKDEEYWRREWEKDQDERAIVDVDVRGWLYSPHKGPMTRRNRVLIGLARQLSGIPAPKTDGRPAAGDSGFLSMHEANEERREQEQVARKAAEIESKGQEEKRVAYHGGYSEDYDDGVYPRRSNSRSPNPASISSIPGSPKMTAKEYTSASELTDAELTIANANLMARIAPFMTTPLIQLPITIFFYNDTKSASRTVQTDDAGHFAIRAALEFVPTHVRVLANSDLSTTQEVKITEPRGVSLISDIDDTIKRSNISAGAKEIFRNTFIRELQDLTISGVKEWYSKLHKMGVSIHYCSNSPWQLFPVLATYFMIAGLPPGSLHLKQYSGMLQGIFEPVAERKRGTLQRLLTDFPERSFLLVGDSGEADLEVYTELVMSHPGRVLAVFIRDVTTPEETGYFSSSFDPGSAQGARLLDASDEMHNRPSLPPRGAAKTAGPVMGDLIDFSDEPATANLDNMSMLSQLNFNQPRRAASTTDLSGKKPPPPPKKPAALRSMPSEEDRSQNSRGIPVPPLPLSRKPIHSNNSASDLLRNARMPAGPPSRASTESLASIKNSAPPPPPPRRRGTPNSIASGGGPVRQASLNDDIDYDPLPGGPQRHTSFGSTAPPRKAAPGALSSAGGSPTLSAQGPQTAADKKVELWKRRLQRAHEVLDAQGVRLYTWRRGEDVITEAVGIVEGAMRGSRGERKAKDDGGRWERELKREQRR